MQSRRLTAVAVSVMLAAAGFATAATPALATAKAKASGGLTKKQVVALIKKYEKPGPRGATGPAGTPGKNGSNGTNGTNGTQFTTAANSGLKLSNGALSVVTDQGLSASNNGLSVNLGDGMGLNTTTNDIQVNLGPGLQDSAGNLVQLDPNYGAWGTCPGAQVLTAISITASGSHTCHYPTFANVVSGGLNTTASNPAGTTVVEDENASGPGSEVSVASTTAPGASAVATTYYLNGEVQLDDTSNTTQTVYCSLLHGTTVVETGADTFGEGFGEVNIQGVVNATTGDAFSVQCEDQTAQTYTTAGGTLTVLPLTQ